MSMRIFPLSLSISVCLHLSLYISSSIPSLSFYHLLSLSHPISSQITTSIRHSVLYRLFLLRGAWTNLLTWWTITPAMNWTFKLHVFQVLSHSSRPSVIHAELWKVTIPVSASGLATAIYLMLVERWNMFADFHGHYQYVLNFRNGTPEHITTQGIEIRFWRERKVIEITGSHNTTIESQWN